MSSGRSSQVAACFSVERTKYLMLSKSMPLRSAPQVGIGFMPNTLRALSRFLSIHSGSFLSFEMSVTTSSETPRRADAPAASESDQPNSYWPRFESSGRSISTSDMGYLLSAAANHSARTGIALGCQHYVFIGTGHAPLRENLRSSLQGLLHRRRGFGALEPRDGWVQREQPRFHVEEHSDRADPDKCGAQEVQCDQHGRDPDQSLLAADAAL